jgi:hypothetical protein
MTIDGPWRRCAFWAQKLVVRQQMETEMKLALLVAAVMLAASSGFVLGRGYGPSVVGGPGYLSGWTVSVNGREICDDPYIWDSTHEIECD